MKTIGVEQTSLDSCVAAAQQEHILVTKGGEPVAIVVGVQGLDEEQIELGSSDDFWEMISARRQETTISRAELDAALAKVDESGTR